jgi:proteasome alpha subunit
MTPEMMGYDRASTVFSPDGRLFQVQYAMEAVRRGATAIGIVCKDGVVLAADKRISNVLMVHSFVEKIFEVDDHVGVATSGLVADGRKLVDDARIESQRNHIVFDEAIEIASLVKRICDIKQLFTQYGGLRPFGVSLLIVGVDETGPRLFETDPSGTPTEWKATAVGEGRKEVLEYLKENYKDDISLEKGLGLVFKALQRIMKEPIEPEKIEAAIITTKERKFTKLGKDRLVKYLKKLEPEKDKD